MDFGDCPICYENFDTDFIKCMTCFNCVCIQCLVSMKTALCPFCRQKFTGIDIHDFSSSSLSSTESNGHDEFIGLHSDWNVSRINRHQTKKIYKRQADEAQRIKNAQLSRSHNHRENSRRNSRKHFKTNLQFEIDD